MATPSAPLYTDAQLSDGTTLRFKGQLAPDQVKQKVLSYRASQPTQFEQANAPKSPGLTGSGIDPGAENPVSRTLSSAGGALMSTPGMIYNAVRHPIDTATGMAKDVSDSAKAWADPKTRPSWEGIKSVLPEALGLGIGNTAGGELAGKVAGGTVDAAKNIKTGLRTTGQEIMNEGPSKMRVLEDQHAHATAAQKHVADIATKVHDDAQAAMANVSQKIDEAKPEGVFDKKDVSNRVVDAIGDTADHDQLPKSIRSLLPGDGLDSMRRSTGPSVGGRHFDLSNPSDLKAYQKLRDQGAFTPQEIGRMEGTASGDAHTFGELQQIRSKVGKEMQSLNGPPQAASSAVYKELSNMLREGARDAGAEPEWIDANARWKGYLDDFQRSPLKRTLEGDNAHDIMGSLASDATRVQVRDILSKYQPFGADINTLDQEVGRYNFQHKVDRLSQPSQRTVLMAAISPKVAAIKTVMSRSMREPSRASALMGKGFDAQVIKPKQVYPTKEAALAAREK